MFLLEILQGVSIIFLIEKYIVDMTNLKIKHKIPELLNRSAIIDGGTNAIEI